MCWRESGTGKIRAMRGFTVCRSAFTARVEVAVHQDWRRKMNGAVIEIIQPAGKNEEPAVVARAVYEHPLIVRLCHWINTVALFVMVGSGLQIFRAFPS